MLEVDKKTFEDEVLKAEGYVFVDFFGDGCVPQKILGLPVMAIYKDGEKVEEVVKDDATQESIEAMIKKYI